MSKSEKNGENERKNEICFDKLKNRIFCVDKG